ncbi:hypothetical protein Hypma_007113 [Hypsizygus marmoreus]|uniref:Uncharacterized protein n=1 Tax=Hypsizygus marmoreus TaxID=39966 RepID=A0A369K9M6_HYPMA|nr:hypothetical protein Hypma_007113 [Hypsizygus marmoreus]
MRSQTPCIYRIMDPPHEHPTPQGQYLSYHSALLYGLLLVVMGDLLRLSQPRHPNPTFLCQPHLAAVSRRKSPSTEKRPGTTPAQST